MKSIGDACNELKQQYDACFNEWFSDCFLKGNNDDSACAKLLEAYQNCVKKAMSEHQIDFQEMEKDVLGSEHERHPPPKMST